jgi:hypothetical protein
VSTVQLRVTCINRHAQRNDRPDGECVSWAPSLGAVNGRAYAASALTLP